MDTSDELFLVLVLIVFVASAIWHRKKTQQDKAELENAIEKALGVVADYREVLERTNDTGFIFRSEANLPYPKAEIRRCIEKLLALPFLDAERLDNLEACNVLLNDFIPDEEYRIVNLQTAGLSQAMRDIASGERDAVQIYKTAGDGVTEEGEALFRQVADRTRSENLLTQERHKAIAVIRSKLAEFGVK
jgi:hypothetical protein